MSLLDAFLFGYRYIENALSPLPARQTLNFGSGLTAVDDPTNECTTVTATSSGATPAGSNGDTQIKSGSALAAGHANDDGTTFAFALPLGLGVRANFATVGATRLDNASALAGVYARNNAGSADLAVWTGDSTNALYIGCDSSLAHAWSTVDIYPTGALALGLSGVTWLYFNGSAIQSSKPIIGFVSPYGSHGMVAIAMSGATHDLTNTEYPYATIKVTGTGTNIIRFPPPASDAAAYEKMVWNAGTGTLAVKDTNNVAAAATLAAGAGARFLFANGAVKQITAAFTVA